MKSKYLSLVALSACLSAMAPVDAGARLAGDFGLYVRRHVEHSQFDDLPFGKNNHSIGLNYEFHEDSAYWQIGVSYTPDLSSSDDAPDPASYAVTPEINLIAKDGIYHGGIGVATTYTDADGGDWSSIYWQLILGLRFEITQRVSLSAYGYYPYKRWGAISDFRIRDIEYGVRFGANF